MQHCKISNFKFYEGESRLHLLPARQCRAACALQKESAEDTRNVTARMARQQTEAKGLPQHVPRNCGSPSQPRGSGRRTRAFFIYCPHDFTPCSVVVQRNRAPAPRPLFSCLPIAACDDILLAQKLQFVVAPSGARLLFHPQRAQRRLAS